MNPDIYTSEERLEIVSERTKAYQRGRPEIVQRINAGLEAEVAFSTLRKLWAPKVKPEKPVESSDTPIEPPPYVGTGSTTAAWRKFAKQVSDMDPEVIGAMGRADIITVLKDKGIIDA